MKRVVVAIIFVMVTLTAKAQSYVGFLTDNYSGVHGVIANPANIADSRFKTDINLIGASGFFANDYVGVGFSELTGSDFEFDTDANLYLTDNNNFSGNIDIMGPSFMFNVGKTSSMAIYTRARTILTGNEFNGESIDDLDDSIDESQDFMVNEGDFYMSGNSWAEIGLTYAQVLMNNEQHFLKGGLSLKYLQGFGNAYVTGKNVTIDYDADGATLPDSSTSGTLESTGDLYYGRSGDYDDDDYDYEVPDANGFGFDLGVVYEWRPDYGKYVVKGTDGKTSVMKNKNKYKLKLGLSLTDIGAVKYKGGLIDNYNINNTITQEDYDNIEDSEDLQNLYTFVQSNADINAKLPTALHLNVDWNIKNHFYLNLNTDLTLRSSGENTMRTVNLVSLTPRFESKWFSFYVPISGYQYSGLQIGAGLRAGPLYLGSGSIISTFTRSEIKGADVYAGLKIPVYYGQPKDSDGDGIPNKEDGCPKKAGPIENNGCPWGDTDGDSVLDNEDQCPDEAGPVENNGCPWVDTDGDTLLDNEDQCVDVAGPVENNGCPWPDSDGDSVFDKDDDCPNEIGTVANNGCPEPVVTEEVQKSLNAYAKTILFTTGKSTLKDESTPVLVDIISILNEYPNAKFTVEGHTDSIGSVVTNQKLSEQRAQAVLQFLVKGGISPSRLTAIGYGESKPIATNMYKDGRQKNRRVEINLAQ
ncbi:DUF5723 family protein [Maribacter confluentis]|uniref:DUF5723 family protein n=1 Tax=Maribacter confluentis TaxID=1656093 RepID=A0ABT8RNP3_9FLAO|nr:DUF5723 family protein [Maribacter confluentis]MDO1512042.1 DUF5723 family protein [Maribacter confluentis]